MICSNPQRAYISAVDARVQFSSAGSTGEVVFIACKKCLGCTVKKSEDWMIRLSHEAQMHSNNCFVTLTYDVEELPMHGSICSKDVRLFVKRLRHHLGDAKLRFYIAGEYGSKEQRPHYHGILFGCDFADKEVVGKNISGDPVYGSDSLAEIWGKGFVSLGDVTRRSARYTASYVLKKLGDPEWLDPVTGLGKYDRIDRVTGEIVQVEEEKSWMSTQPGIGADWFDKYWRDVFPDDFVVLSDGKKRNVPGYYLARLRKIDEEMYQKIIWKRKQAGEFNWREQNGTRRKVKAKLLRRKLENGRERSL